MPEMMVPRGILGDMLSRRAFVINCGILSLAAGLGAPVNTVSADTPPNLFKPNVWVTIGADDIVSIYFALAEMGQGIMTTLPLLIAEEMDANWDAVRVVQSPSDGKLYGTGGTIGTFGSTSTRNNFEKLRLIGAQTRKILLFNAAKRWNLPIDELSTVSGSVVHKISGKSVTFGALADGAVIPDPLPSVTKADLKAAQDFRYIGKALPRTDIPAKVNGSAVFGLDVQPPDLLYGAILGALVQGERPLEVDDIVAKTIDGVIKIVILPHGVGVVAKTVWAAQTAKAALRIKWSTDAKAQTYSSSEVMNEYGALLRDSTRQGAAVLKEGDAIADLSAAVKIHIAEYYSDHVAHVCMEPMNATARVNSNTIDIWASNQAPTAIQKAVAKLAGIAPEQVVVHSTLLGGGFGRRYEVDFAEDAFQLAREVPGQAVKLIYSREDDLQRDPYRALVGQQIQASLDSDGHIAGWRHRVVSESYFARTVPGLMEKLGDKDVLVAGGGEFHYAAKSHLVEYIKQDRGIAVGALRSTASGYTKFAIECMIDELAGIKGIDPVAFRLSLLKDNPRAKKVIETAARLANWGEAQPGSGLGIAYSGDLMSYIAVVAKISVNADSGEIRVHNIWCAFDAGLVVQPVNIAAQIEGGLLFGLSVALYEQLNIDRGKTQESNFGEYRVLRMSEAPEVHVEIIASDNPPSGVGEAAVPAIGPAVANAFAQLTGGKRLRSLPMLPQRVKAAVKLEASL